MVRYLGSQQGLLKFAQMLLLFAGQLNKTEGHKAPASSMFRRWLGVCGCFFVSGVMHELTYRFDCLHAMMHLLACVTYICMRACKGVGVCVLPQGCCIHIHVWSVTDAVVRSTWRGQTILS